MRTRSQTKQTDVVCKDDINMLPMLAGYDAVQPDISGIYLDREIPYIDFDEASRYWTANKKKKTNGCYKYVCGVDLENGLFCKRVIAKNCDTCTIHKQ